MASKNNPITNFLNMVSMIKEREIKAVIFSFLFVVVLMSAYYILRPVRDAMASDWTDAEVSWLWTLNFFISTGIVALYGIAVSKFHFRLLVPTMYGIFAGSFSMFYNVINLFILTFLYVYRNEMKLNYYLYWSFALLFLMGMEIRALQTLKLGLLDAI